MRASMSFRKLCSNSNTGRWIFHICCCCFEIMQGFFFSLLGVKRKVREFCQRCVPKSSNRHFPSFSAQNCSSYTLFVIWSNVALVPTVTKPHGDFWFRYKRTGLSGFFGTRRASVSEGRVNTRRGRWTPCMCGKWVWQGLKLMISTCSLVANHHKEKSADKSTCSATMTVRMGRQKFSSQKNKEDRKYRLSLKPSWPAPEEPYCRSKPWKRVNSESTTQSNHLTHGTIHLFGSAKQPSQLVAMAACCI